MFAAHPELLRVFNEGNQATGEQSRALAASVVAYAVQLIDPDAPPFHHRCTVSTNETASGLRGKGGDQRVVLVDQAELGRAAGAAKVVEELDVGLVVVVLPLLGGVVLVEDGFHRADRFA